MSELRITTIVGTRPELIRLSRLIPLLDEFTNHTLIHTGQNYSPFLNGNIISDLELRDPDHYLDIDTSSFASAVSGILVGVEDLISLHRPDAVVILGDTNSSLAALVCERMGVPVFHLEAGNRSFDHRVPEEFNRRIVDEASTFNLAYTENARFNLLAQGHHQSKVFVTGSPLAEVLAHYANKISNSTVLDALGLEPNRYFIASIHRQENLSTDQSLSEIVSLLGRISSNWGFKVLVSTHPRLKSRLDQLAVDIPEGVSFLDPFAFTDFMALQMGSFCVLSDSGSISEESSIAQFPAVTLRKATERPEAQEGGVLSAVGFSFDAVSIGIRLARTRPLVGPVAGYSTTDFSHRVLSIIVSGLSSLGLHRDQSSE